MSDKSESVDNKNAVCSSVRERIQRVKDAYDAQRRQLESGGEEVPCDLCKVVSADHFETVQNEETGEKMDVHLCEGCHQKTNDYAAGKDVDFAPELRLRKRHTETGTDGGKDDE
ncbi:hypothetical protein ACFQO4_20925 [Saliphagus sp. GCM10025334]